MKRVHIFGRVYEFPDHTEEVCFTPMPPPPTTEEAVKLFTGTHTLPDLKTYRYKIRRRKNGDWEAYDDTGLTV